MGGTRNPGPPGPPAMAIPAPAPPSPHNTAGVRTSAPQQARLSSPLRTSSVAFVSSRARGGRRDEQRLGLAPSQNQGS